MNKKIKVIELINKIYDDDNIPKKLKYQNIVYKYDTVIHEYTATKEHSILYLISNCLNTRADWLDVEVEILEDEEEIDIQNIEELQTYSDSTVYNYNDIDRNRKVLNMLVKAVKKLDKNKVDYIQPYKED